MKIFFAWYDFWIGWYFDRKNRFLYICPLPMLVIQIDCTRRRQPHLPSPDKLFRPLGPDEMCRECGAWGYRNDIGHEEGCSLS